MHQLRRSVPGCLLSLTKRSSRCCPTSGTGSLPSFSFKYDRGIECHCLGAAWSDSRLRRLHRLCPSSAEPSEEQACSACAEVSEPNTNAPSERTPASCVLRRPTMAPVDLLVGPWMTCRPKWSRSLQSNKFSFSVNSVGAQSSNRSQCPPRSKPP